ncbi:MAG: DNRLRE domain-containing protein [Dethiobacter sp.]|nr:DNRLRE domain-containing protein [Dethiobacter sp.]MBS3990420.1 DNRLRE domain-containing protein [Dethiobacter sp.]
MDAAGIYSEAVTLTVRKESGKTYLDLTAEWDWLQNASYPVVIDPTVASGEPITTVHKDTFASSTYPSTTYTDDPFLFSGNNGTYGRTRSFVQFVLPSLTSGAKITSSTFSLYQIASGSTSHTLDIYRVTSFWDAYQTTWNSQPTVGAVEASLSNNAQNQYWNFDVTNLVRAWYGNTQPNYGMMVRHRTETEASRKFNSANNSTSQPRLVINYTVDPIGMESFWGYTPEGINGFNGNLALQATDLHIPGRGVPVTFTRTYNSRAAEDGPLGFGWTANVFARIKDAGYAPITLVDEDGTQHIFSRNTDGSFSAPNGVFLTLVKNADNTYTVTRIDGTVTRFNAAGQITGTTDTNNNTTSFSYTSGRLTSISDASSRITTLTYNASNRLWKITDHANRVTTFEYDANGRLTAVTNPGSQVTRYAYDTARNLLSVTDPRGTKTHYLYTSDNRVRSVNPVNMAINPSFEADADNNGLPDYYTLDNGQAGTASLDAASGTSFGARAFRVSTASTNPAYWSAYLSDSIPVDRSKAYTLSGHLRASLSSGSLTTVLSLIAYNAANQNLGEFARTALSGSFSWQRINFPLGANALPSGTAYVKVRAAVSTSGSGTSWFDAVQLEEGSLTDFTGTATLFYNTVARRTTGTDAKGNQVAYDFRADGNLLQVVDDPSGAAHRTSLAYDTDNNINKVTDANTNAGLKTGSYDFTFISGKGLPNTAKDPLNQQHIYSYDSNNNLKQTVDPNQNVASDYYDKRSNNVESLDTYTQSKASRYFSNGNIDYDTALISAAENLVTNPGLERLNLSGAVDQWVVYKPSGSAAISWSTVPRSGDRSISVANPAVWVDVMNTRTVPFAAGDTYIVSGYVKTSGVSANTASVKVDAYNSSGAWLGEVVGTRLGGTRDWTRLHLAVNSENLPAGTAFLGAGFTTTPMTGTVYFDDAQLEKGTVLTNYNLVENSGMELDANSDTIPDQWTGTSLTANDRIDTFRHVGARSFKITGASGVNKSLRQTVKVSGNANTKLTLSGWSFADNPNPSGGWYGLQMRVFYTDGTSDWHSANDFTKEPHTDWEHIVAEVRPAKAFNAVEIHLYFYNQTGSAWFDDLRLEYGNNISSYGYDTGHNYLTSFKDALGNTTAFQYSAVGNRTRVTDPKGFITNFAFDSLNRLTSVTDADNKVTSYGYDANGNRTGVTDARNNTTTYGYDRFNRLASITDPLNKTTAFSYDEGGLLTQILYPGSGRLNFRYNRLNRLTDLLFNGAARYTFEYDPLGNRTRMSDAVRNESSVFAYTADNNLQRVTEYNNNRTDYTYDAAGNVTTLTATIGGTGYATNFTYDRLYRLTRAAFSGGSARFTYDENGNPAGRFTQNGVTTTYGYNDAKMLSGLQTFAPNGSMINEYRYTYDANGNWTQAQTPSGAVSYTYDSLNRLTSETLPDGTLIEYTYDATGNRLTKKVTQGGSVTTTGYQYGAANQLTSAGGVSYTYDDNGNMTGDGTRTYFYDAANRLVEVRQGANSIAAFAYDADGRRVSMTTASGTVRFFYDGTSTRVLYETDGGGNLLARYVYGPGGRLLAMVRGGVTYYYHYNGHGDVVALTDASGTVVATYDYDAFGNHIGSTGSVVNPYRYAGYRWDAETGLYYLNARYYLPSVGRFISRDAFHGFEDDPASLNQYNYARSNPVMFVDPSGYFAISLSNSVTLGLSALVFVPGVGQVSLLGIAVAVGGAWLISKYGLPWAIRQYQASKAKKQVDDAAGQVGLTPIQRKIFGRVVENYKGEHGRGPNDNIPWAILIELARQVKNGMYK